MLGRHWNSTLNLAIENFRRDLECSEPDDPSHSAAEKLLQDLNVGVDGNSTPSRIVEIAREYQSGINSNARKSIMSTPLSLLFSGVALNQYAQGHEVDQTVVAQHRESLTTAFNECLHEPAFVFFRAHKMLMTSLDSVFELTNFVLRYAPEDHPFLDPTDLDLAFYSVFHYELICRARDVLLDLLLLKSIPGSDHDAWLSWDAKAFNVINGLYSYLADVSEVSTCPVNLRVMLRLDIIGYSQPEPLNFGCDDSDPDLIFSEKLDVVGRDLRISSADLELVSRESQFCREDWQRYLTEKYCYDICED